MNAEDQKMSAILNQERYKAKQNTRNVQVRGRQHGANGTRNVNVRLTRKRFNSPPLLNPKQTSQTSDTVLFSETPMQKKLNYYLQSNNLQKENQRI